MVNIVDDRAAATAACCDKEVLQEFRCFDRQNHAGHAPKDVHIQHKANAQLAQAKLNQHGEHTLKKLVQVRLKHALVVVDQSHTGKLTFRAALAPQSDEGSEILSGMGVNDMYKLKVSVTMPGEIKSHSAGTAEENTVTWEIQDLTAENSIEVVSETGSGSIVPVIIVALLILVLLAVIGILLAKKKHQK